MGSDLSLLCVLDNTLFLVARQPYREPTARHDLGCMDIECPHCGALHWMMERLMWSSATSPEFSFCCKSGKVQLPALQAPPEALKALFDGEDEQAKEFWANIWKYNRAFVFTSLKVKENHSVNRGHGPPVFRIQGELFHHGGPLEPAPRCDPMYAQLYIYDPQAALEHCHHQNAGLNVDTLCILQRVILDNHQYAAIYTVIHRHVIHSKLVVKMRN